MNTITNPVLLSKHYRYCLFGILILLLLASEGHHFISAFHFPDPTLAVFFLAGRYIRQWQSWPILFLITFSCDYYLINFQGVNNFCFTSSYTFLIFAYGAMWFAGLFTRNYPINASGNALTLVAAISLGTFFAFLISNGSFYWLSGRYPEPHFHEYLQRAAMYLPSYMATPWFWLGIAAVAEFIASQSSYLNRKINPKSHH